MNHPVESECVMDGDTTSQPAGRKAILYRIAPGSALAAYRRDWLRYDLIAGVSVAAVALPTAIAYAQIIGLDPVVGLYAAIPALLAYALFGTSRHLIVNPDAATCAMNHAMGGKSQLAGLVAAAVMAAVLLFLTGPLSYLPRAALGAVLIVAAIGLFDVASLRRLWRVSRAEFAVAIATMLGVIALDVLAGILMAVTLALLLLLRRSARPPDAVLGRVPGMKGFHDLAHHPDARTTPGLLLYRFGAAIVFYNATYLKKRILELAATQLDLKWVVIDGSTVNTIDSTGADTVETLARDLARQGIRLGLAGFRSETRGMLERAGTMAAIGTDSVYPTVKVAMNAFLEIQSPPPASVLEAGDTPADASGDEVQNE